MARTAATDTSLETVRIPYALLQERYTQYEALFRRVDAWTTANKLTVTTDWDDKHLILELRWQLPPDLTDLGPLRALQMAIQLL